jgi:hypothetical protein
MKVEAADNESYQLGMALVDNEDFQNANTYPLWLERMKLGAAVDCLIDDETFGLTADNPVPVNGQFGQLTYLSRLRTPSGAWFVFHRLGSKGLIDIYEVLSIDGAHRFEVFLDLYHPRRSRKPIRGFTLDERPNVWTGSPMTVPNFPEGLLSDLARHSDGVGLGYARPSQVKPAIDKLIGILDA